MTTVSFSHSLYSCFLIANNFDPAVLCDLYLDPCLLLFFFELLLVQFILLYLGQLLVPFIYLSHGDGEAGPWHTLPVSQRRVP